MTDDVELDELDQVEGKSRSPYKASHWRDKVAKRLLARAQLIWSWLWITVIPQYGWRALFSMALITAGRLADAASFVVGTHIVTRSLSQADAASSGFQGGLTLAAFAMAGILSVSSILGYIGYKLAVKITLDYEQEGIVDAFKIVRRLREQGQVLSGTEENNLVRQAPRMMSRAVLFIMNACTSVVLTLSGLAACIGIFPWLTLLVLLSLIAVSPAYIWAAIHSTNIGHGIRTNDPVFTETLKRFKDKWFNSETFDPRAFKDEIFRDEGYVAYHSTYLARLTLSARNHLISSLTLAFVIGLSFVWIAHEVELSAKSVASIISFLVSLRLFAHGLAGIFQGIQSLNTTLPFFLSFLMHDPRFTKTKA